MPKRNPTSQTKPQKDAGLCSRLVEQVEIQLLIIIINRTKTGRYPYKMRCTAIHQPIDSTQVFQLSKL